MALTNSQRESLRLGARALAVIERSRELSTITRAMAFQRALDELEDALTPLGREAQALAQMVREIVTKNQVS